MRFKVFHVKRADKHQQIHSGPNRRPHHPGESGNWLKTSKIQHMSFLQKHGDSCRSLSFTFRFFHGFPYILDYDQHWKSGPWIFQPKSVAHWSRLSRGKQSSVAFLQAPFRSNSFCANLGVSVQGDQCRTGWWWRSHWNMVKLRQLKRTKWWGPAASLFHLPRLTVKSSWFFRRWRQTTCSSKEAAIFLGF